MSSLFDKLQNELENREEEGGISPLDLAELPPNQRKLMRHLLREVEATFERIEEIVSGLDTEARISREELGEALQELAKQGWVITFGEGERLRYRVNLRRKRGSQLAASIWGALDEKIEKHSKKDKGTEEE